MFAAGVGTRGSNLLTAWTLLLNVRGKQNGRDIPKRVSPVCLTCSKEAMAPQTPQQRTKLPAELDSREVRDTMGRMNHYGI